MPIKYMNINIPRTQYERKASKMAHFGVKIDVLDIRNNRFNKSTFTIMRHEISELKIQIINIYFRSKECAILCSMTIKYNSIFHSQPYRFSRTFSTSINNTILYSIKQVDSVSIIYIACSSILGVCKMCAKKKSGSYKLLVTA